MIERDATASVRAARYDEMPFSRLLFRYLWPFWLFRDATRGDWRARAAAYRHNRTMRVHLPGYLVRWLLGSAFAFAATAAFDALAIAAGPFKTLPASFYAVLAAGGGILFAGSICVVLMTSYVYLYLGKHDN
jgi:hypothetical protein